MHDRLAGLASDGFSAKQIAVTLTREFRVNVTRNAVIGRCHRQGMTLTGTSDVRNSPSYLAPPRKAMVVRAAPPPPLPLPPADEVGKVALADLEDNHCRYLIGDLYCGDDRVLGSSYCEAHRSATVQSVNNYLNAIRNDGYLLRRYGK